MVVVLGAQQMKILIPVEDADLANVQLDFVTGGKVLVTQF